VLFVEGLDVKLYQNVYYVLELRVMRPENHCEEGRRHCMPVVFIEAPPGIKQQAKKLLVEKITAAIDDAYHIGDTLIFLREYPAENVAMDGRLQSENPKILEALKKIGA
jgi:phenylpyruvate tautomerase PptA (4-oxalocrotonate tautomerase family)